MLTIADFLWIGGCSILWLYSGWKLN